MATRRATSDEDEEPRGALGAARYSWSGDLERTRVLIRLVRELVEPKPEYKRRVTASEWEILLDAFNREVQPPADCARVLHNRMANLRMQCKDYHLVLKAQRAGQLESVDDWVAFIKANPMLRKWRKKPFAFYEEMAACLKLQGEDLDEEQSDDPSPELSSQLPPRRKPGRPRSTPPPSAADVSPLVALSRQRNDEFQAANAAAAAAAGSTTTTTTNGRNVRRRTASGSSPTSPGQASGAVVSISHYPAALRHLAKLNLPLEDRVDAKRFLVPDANSQAFIYMDDDERRFYLQKYCFDRRDEIHANAQPTAPPPPPSSSTDEKDE